MRTRHLNEARPFRYWEGPVNHGTQMLNTLAILLDEHEAARRAELHHVLSHRMTKGDDWGALRAVRVLAGSSETIDVGKTLPRSAWQ